MNHILSILLVALLSCSFGCKTTVNAFVDGSADAAGPCPGARPTEGNPCDVPAATLCWYVVEQCPCSPTDLREYLSCEGGEWTYGGREFDCDERCGGAIDGGTGDGFDGGDADTEMEMDGGPPPTRCPTTSPTADEPCAENGQLCSYSEICDCNDGSTSSNSFTCMDGSWAQTSTVDACECGEVRRARNVLSCDECEEGTYCTRYYSSSCSSLATYCIESTLTCGSECSTECKVELCNMITPGEGAGGPYGCGGGGCVGASPGLVQCVGR